MKINKGMLWNKFYERIGDCDGIPGKALDSFEDDPDITDEEFQTIDDLYQEWNSLGNYFWDMEKAAVIMRQKYGV